MQENKQEKSQIKQNILFYLSKKGVTPYEFYKESGVTRGILQQNNGISEYNMARFLAYAPEVNTEWLLTGKGAMLKKEAHIIQQNKVNVKGHNNSVDNSIQTGSSKSTKIDNRVFHSSPKRKSDDTSEYVNSLLRIIDEKDKQIAEKDKQLAENSKQITALIEALSRK